ncbi:MAG TPA: hypothetical protein VFI29_05620 [Hanamia sp.]|nr:hypothetical protein [Hanamia sp.]
MKNLESQKWVVTFGKFIFSKATNNYDFDSSPKLLESWTALLFILKVTKNFPKAVWNRAFQKFYLAPE